METKRGNLTLKGQSDIEERWQVTRMQMIGLDIEWPKIFLENLKEIDSRIRKYSGVVKTLDYN